MKIKVIATLLLISAVINVNAQEINKDKKLPTDFLDVPVAVMINVDDYAMADKSTVESIKHSILDLGVNVATFYFTSPLSNDLDEMKGEMKKENPKYMMTCSFGPGMNSIMVTNSDSEDLSSVNIFGQSVAGDMYSALKKFKRKTNNLKKENSTANQVKYDSKTAKFYSHIDFSEMKVVDHLPKDMSTSKVFFSELEESEITDSDSKLIIRRKKRMNKRAVIVNDIVTKQLKRYPFEKEMYVGSKTDDIIKGGAQYICSMTATKGKGVKYVYGKVNGSSEKGYSNKIVTQYSVQPILFDFKNKIIYLGKVKTSQSPYIGYFSIISDAKKMKKGKYEYK